MGSQTKQIHSRQINAKRAHKRSISQHSKYSLKQKPTRYSTLSLKYFNNQQFPQNSVFKTPKRHYKSGPIRYLTPRTSKKSIYSYKSNPNFTMDELINPANLEKLRQLQENTVANQRAIDFQRKKDTNYSRKHDWYFLASELAFCSSFLSILGCIMAFSVHYTFNNDASFYACIPTFLLSLPVILIEWNRPVKTNGRKVPPRYFNGIFELSSLSFLNKKFDKISAGQFWLMKHFLFRAVFYLMLSAGCFVNIATHLAFYGFGLSGAIYLLAFLVVGKELKMGVSCSGDFCVDSEKAKPKKPATIIRGEVNKSYISGPIQTISGALPTKSSGPVSVGVVPGRGRGRMNRVQSHGIKRGSICYFDKEEVFKPKAERQMSIARRASSARQVGWTKLRLMMNLDENSTVTELTEEEVTKQFKS